MKKLSLLFALLLVSAIFYAQLIKYDPEISQGYIVINEKADTLDKVSFWRVQINQREYLHDGGFDDKIISEFDMMDVNYFKLDREYYTSIETCYVLIIEGLAKDGKIVVSQDPFHLTPPRPPNGPGSSYDFHCAFTCNGATYAWQINQFVNTSSGNSYFSLYNYYFDQQSQIPIPHYEWMGETEYFTLCQNEEWLKKHYLIPFGCDQYATNQLLIVHLTNVWDNDHQDKNGVPIHGHVYGVGKTKGYWNGGLFISNNLLVGPLNCDPASGSGDYAIQLINNYRSILSDPSLPELVCHNIVWPTPPGPQPSTSIAALTLADCDEGLLLYDPEPGDDMYDFYEWIYTNCSGGGTSGSAIDWDPNVLDITITPLNFEGESITVTETDLFAPNGEFIGPSFKMQAGLYNVFYRFIDNSFFPVIRNYKEPIDNTYELSNFLIPTIYPVPVTEDKFDINLKASAKLKFIYRLFDENANEIYSKNFVIQKNHERDYQIKPQGGIPEGMLINRFEFEDGSYISIQTNKL